MRRTRGERFNPYRTFVGAMTPNWLMRMPGLSPGAKLCYARMAQFAGNDGNVFATEETLAKELGVSERQAARYIAELKRAGLIAVAHRRFGGSNHYSFHWPEGINESDLLAIVGCKQ